MSIKKKNKTHVSPLLNKPHIMIYNGSIHAKSESYYTKTKLYKLQSKSFCIYRPLYPNHFSRLSVVVDSQKSN